ncbi:unnamed protein product [Allacma fusca]|uniref:S-protein homolog n=1 Tax=Allacma fusca TaxID=39272 RepID=A0A8J2JTE9_9HEXA|nr:unnamed protein product [Allacma fusca]
MGPFNYVLPLIVAFIFACSASPLKSVEDGGEILKNTVLVKCLVPYGDCKIKCWSGDDVVGPAVFKIGEEMSFTFTGLAWTKFWCEAWWGSTAYVTHPAYDAGAPRQGNHFELDNFGANLVNWQTNLAWKWQGVAPPPESFV